MGVSIVLVFGYELVALGPRGGSLLDQVHAVGEEATHEIRAELLATHPNLQIEIEMMQDRPVDALVNRSVEGRAARISYLRNGAPGADLGARRPRRSGRSDLIDQTPAQCLVRVDRAP